MAKAAAHETFADRLLRLKGEESYESLASRMAKRGIKITAQALHKWCHGGGITPENAKEVAKFFEITPGELLFGEEQRKIGDDLSREAQLIGRAWDKVPERMRRELGRDLLKTALAYTEPSNDKERNFMAKVRSAIDDLTKDTVKRR